MTHPMSLHHSLKHPLHPSYPTLCHCTLCITGRLPSHQSLCRPHGRGLGRGRHQDQGGRQELTHRHPRGLLHHLLQGTKPFHDGMGWEGRKSRIARFSFAIILSFPPPLHLYPPPPLSSPSHPLITISPSPSSPFFILDHPNLQVTATNVKEIPAIAQIAKAEIPRSVVTPTLPAKDVAMAMGKIAPITNTATKTTATATTATTTTATVASKSKGTSSDPLRASIKSK